MPADDRLRAALARLVLPRDWDTPLLRRLAGQIEYEYPHSAKGLRHIADQLDGPLAEAWERSVWICAGNAYPNPEHGVKSALRALEEPGG